jgi:electron transport complex protein RnfG
MMARSVIQHGVALAVFAAICAFVLAFTQAKTAEPIAQAKAKARAQALAEVMPPDYYLDPILDESLEVSSATGTRFIAPGTKILRALSNGMVVGVIIPIRTPEGYSGDIDLLVGVDNTLAITGVRVLAHKETPGLGDKIQRNKSPWIDSFLGKSLSNTQVNAWTVKKDGGSFDQFTGATITPRAVIRGVHSTLIYARDNYQILFESPLPDVLSDITLTEDSMRAKLISQLGAPTNPIKGATYAE